MTITGFCLGLTLDQSNFRTGGFRSKSLRSSCNLRGVNARLTSLPHKIHSWITLGCARKHPPSTKHNQRSCYCCDQTSWVSEKHFLALLVQTTIAKKHETTCHVFHILLLIIAPNKNPETAVGSWESLSWAKWFFNHLFIHRNKASTSLS